MNNSQYHKHLPTLLDTDSTKKIHGVADKLQDADFRCMAKENPKAAFALCVGTGGTGGTATLTVSTASTAGTLGSVF